MDVPDVTQQCTSLVDVARDDDGDNDVIFEHLDQAVQYGYTLREAAGVMLCVALALIKERWDAG